ncbi:reverse transcriptase family protein [Vreelandella zhaodongensis]|uniref:reverse transcriptase family protein n=1 Tax=Vreelandella zhaodongensis TaxID=1176240 RepID=UPI003EBDA12D
MWSPHQYRAAAKQKGLSDETVQAAIEQIEAVEEGAPGLPAILSLNHLATRAQVSYLYLRSVAARSEANTYRKFSISKRSGGRRFIHVPEPTLAHVQKWINTYILRHASVHKASFAFAPGASIYKCAARHCGARWLIKMDITGFFESVSEIQVFRCFKALGYQPLIAFELARIVTVEPLGKSPRHRDPVWKVRKYNSSIPSYSARALGYLPQGAPTSPMLSNIVMKSLDEKIADAARNAGLVYTRYSDDLTFSTIEKDFSRSAASEFVHVVDSLLSASGFRSQHRKTKVVPPGSRKIVLGLNVEEEKPKLRREFKDNLRMHLYYLIKHGPAEHAKERDFETIWGMKSHIRGLIDYAKMVEPNYSIDMLKRFNNVLWPY